MEKNPHRMRVANLFLLLALVGDCRKDLFMTIHCPGSSFATVRGPDGIEHSVRFEDGSGAEAVISASGPGKHRYVCQEGEYGFSYATSGIEFYIKDGKGYVNPGFVTEESDTVLGDLKCLLVRGEGTQTTTYRVKAGRTKQIPGELILRSDGESYSCSVHLRSGGRTMDRADFVYKKGEKYDKNTNDEDSTTTMPTKKASTKTTTTTTTVSSANISRSAFDEDKDEVKGVSGNKMGNNTDKDQSAYPEKNPEGGSKNVDKKDIYDSDDEDSSIDHSGWGSDGYTDSDYGNFTAEEADHDNLGKPNRTSTNNNSEGGIGTVETIIIAAAVVGIIVFAFIAAGTAILRDTRGRGAENDVFLGNNPASGFPPPNTDSYLIPHPDSSRNDQEEINLGEDIGGVVGTSGAGGPPPGPAPLASPEEVESQGSGEHEDDDDENNGSAGAQATNNWNADKRKGVKGPPKPERSYTHLLPYNDLDDSGNGPLDLRRALNQVPKLHGYDVKFNWRGPIKDNKLGQMIMEIERKNAQKESPEDDGQVAVSEDQGDHDGIEV